MGRATFPPTIKLYILSSLPRSLVSYTSSVPVISFHLDQLYWLDIVGTEGVNKYCSTFTSNLRTPSSSLHLAHILQGGPKNVYRFLNFGLWGKINNLVHHWGTYGDVFTQKINLIQTLFFVFFWWPMIDKKYFALRIDFYLKY